VRERIGREGAEEDEAPGDLLAEMAKRDLIIFAEREIGEERRCGDQQPTVRRDHVDADEDLGERERPKLLDEEPE
jgi:hypothetical protein